MRPCARLRIVAWVAAIAGLFAPSAIASRVGSPFGFAIDAVGFKSYFVFDVRPGDTVHGSLRLVSLTPAAKTILLTPVDVSTAVAGGLQYGQSPHGDGRWLTLSLSSVRLSSGSAEVPFTVRVPRGARSGDHFAGIVALDRRVLSRPATGHGSIRLRLIPRVAMTVQVRLPGQRTSELAVGGAKIDIAPSGASLALGISNPGNTLIPSSTGSVTVSQGGNPLFSQGIELAAFVPKTAITYHVPWEGTPVEGTYRVKGELRPSGAPPILIDRTVTFGRAATRQFRRQTGRQAKETSGTPALLVAALAFAAALAATFAVAYVRARRKIGSGR